MANFQITNVRIRIKQDTSTNWNRSSLIPLVGEMCLATDTGELRYGDGINSWSNLTSSGLYVKEADKLHTTRTITFVAHPAGTNPNEDPAIPTDVEGTFSFDGSQNVSTQLTLVDTTRTDASADNTATVVITGITSDPKGRITATTKMDAIDETTGSTDAGKLVKTNSNGQIDDSLFVDGTNILNENQVISAEYLTGEIENSNTESGTTTNTEVDMASKVETTTNGETTVTYSQNYVLNAVNI